MFELVMAAVQAACIAGLLFGAYLSIGEGEKPAVRASDARFDPVTTHAWQAAQVRRRNGRS